MTHEDTGHYAGKRRGVKLDERIAAKLKEKISQDRISCAEAHGIAAELNVAPAEVGTAIDLLEARIIKCQLGLFGHGREKNIPTLSEKVNPEIEQAVKSALVNNRISCATSWEIASRFNISRPMMAAVCESMKVKVSPCQLGAF